MKFLSEVIFLSNNAVRNLNAIYTLLSNIASNLDYKSNAYKELDKAMFHLEVAIDDLNA